LGGFGGVSCNKGRLQGKSALRASGAVR